MSQVVRIARPEHPATALASIADRADVPCANPRQELLASDTRRRQGPIRFSGVPGTLDKALLPVEAASSGPDLLPDIVVLTGANAAALLTRRFGCGAAADSSRRRWTGGGRGTRDHCRADIKVDHVSQRAIDEAVEMLRPAVERFVAARSDRNEMPASDAAGASVRARPRLRATKRGQRPRDFRL